MDEKAIRERIASLEKMIAEGKQEYTNMQKAFQDIQNKIVLLEGARQEKLFDLQNLATVPAVPAPVEEVAHADAQV